MKSQLANEVGKNLVVSNRIFNEKTSLARLLSEKYPQERLRSFWKKVNKRKISPKSVTVVLGLEMIKTWRDLE